MLITKVRFFIVLFIYFANFGQDNNGDIVVLICGKYGLTLYYVLSVNMLFCFIVSKLSQLDMINFFFWNIQLYHFLALFFF